MCCEITAAWGEVEGTQNMWSPESYMYLCYTQRKYHVWPWHSHRIIMYMYEAESMPRCPFAKFLDVIRALHGLVHIRVHLLSYWMLLGLCMHHTKAIVYTMAPFGRWESCFVNLCFLVWLATGCVPLGSNEVVNMLTIAFANNIIIAWEHIHVYHHLQPLLIARVNPILKFANYKGHPHLYRESPALLTWCARWLDQQLD